MTTTYDVVQKICLGLPETDEIVSHGSPSFRVREKGFAIYSVNHHGDGKVALLLNAEIESQHMLVSSAPRHFFIPPYIGTRGWVGVELNQGLSWERISQLVFEAYVRTAPFSISKNCQPISCHSPTIEMTLEEIDPLKSKDNQAIIRKLRKFCLSLPETKEDLRFGNPVFKAGSKSFCNIGHGSNITKLQIWVGADRQESLVSFDERYKIPAYTGHNGWIDFNLTAKQDWKEIEKLVLESYRHFALKRMLKVIDD